MRPFTYRQGTDAPGAVRIGIAAPATTAYLAGGTTLLDLMKLDVMRPAVLVDINPLQERHGGIEPTSRGLRLGALARMADVAADAGVRRDYPVVAESLALAASAQLRNMASLGGNLLQRTRCSYFRDTSYEACNKRRPGSGCAALEGVNRIHAVLGTTDKCIASYPGDFAQALIALDGEVETLGPDGARTIPFARLHLPRADTPEIETVLRPGELITALFIPAGPHTRRSTYVKVRDRESYAFALAAAAVALDLGPDGVVRDVRIGLGGIHYAPYRATAAEAVLRGRPLDEAAAGAAATAALAGAVTHGHNDYKPELARRTLVRALLQAQRMRI
ncbi:MAG: xanthine dehydrogenase family protein subunit M [Variovorax sp.]|jgi:xanthine dehydrogenase YagS FAD-binding subunit|nr:MAG: xanthine dehydrogenase family protein subunit M [Variovorax sp.]